MLSDQNLCNGVLQLSMTLDVCCVVDDVDVDCRVESSQRGGKVTLDAWQQITHVSGTQAPRHRCRE